MSNKALGITIVIILVVAIGGVIAWKLGQDRRAEFAQDANQPPLTLDAPTPVTTPTPIPTPTPATTGIPTPSTTNSPAACVRNVDTAKLSMNVDPQNKFVDINVANFGTIEVTLYPQDAPKAVENFLRLANSGYYNCLTFHRVAKGFVIQGGDPNGNGTGGQSAYGAPFADELNPNTASYKAGYVQGVLAMANSGPNTNGSQFFIMLADQPSMPHLYTIFGKVVSGQDVVNKIGQVPITPNLQMDPSGTDGTPVTPLVMQSVTVVSK